MIKKPFWLILGGALAALTTSCSNDKDEVAGGTEAESTIALQIQLADGAPAAKSRIRVLPVGYLSDGLSQEEWSDTDDRGYVKLTVDPGEYSVEIRGESDSSALGAVFTKSVELQEVSAVDSIALGALTTIEGFVAPGQGPSVIRIPGLERFVVPDSAGHFVIDSLPAGNFEVLIESRSNRGTIKLSASAGETVPEINLGAPRGFAVEDFESFSGISATGAILGDGWWFTMDADGQNLMPLWDESLTQTFSGNDGCASGGCARIFGEGKSSRSSTHLGFLLGGYRTDYELPGFDSLMFSARGHGTLHVALSAYDSSAKSIEFDVDLSKVWQGFALPVGSKKVAVNRIDFSVNAGDSVFLDDVFLGGVSEESLKKISMGVGEDRSTYPADWKDHAALLREVVGYASGVRGGEGYIDSLAADSIQGEICLVTTTEDYIIVEDTTNVDSTGKAATTAVIAPGSLRDCAYRDGPTWILFEKSGTYNLTAALRIKSNKTFDGRGRDIRISGMGIMTEESSNLIFENLTFSAPSTVVSDTANRRAISLHNNTHHVWIDHCSFEEYPIVEVDVKRGSHDVTISWSRFENAETGVLFGLTPDLIDESTQTLTLHHNFFDNMSWSGAFARRGRLHAFNNFFKNLDRYAVECTDSASCYIEGNVFNMDDPVLVYSFFDDEGAPIDTSVGFPKMVGNWYTVGGDPLKVSVSSLEYKPDYGYLAEPADADLAWTLKDKTGPR